MIVESCNFPEDVLYDIESNTWLKKYDEFYRLGINSFLAWLSGKFMGIRFHAKDIVEKGQIICSMDAVRRFDVIRSPFKAKIKALNEDLLRRPILLNKDPYGSGWIADLEPLQEVLSFNYKSIEEIKEAIANQIKMYKVRCFSEYPDYEFFEVGVECSTVLAKINELFANSEIGTVVHI